MNRRWFAASLVSTIVASFSAAGELDLTKYPKSSEIAYGGAVAQVHPNDYVKLKAPITGSLQIKLGNGTYEKGAIWAEFEPEKIALEREVMELSKSLHKLKEEPIAKLEISDARAGLQRRMDELSGNLAMLDEINAEPELASFYLGEKKGNSAKSLAAVQQMRTNLKTQMKALKEALEFVGTPEQERVELRLAQLQLERKEADLDRREQDSKLKLPFNGELKYLATLPKDPEEPLMLMSGDEIAEIADYSRLVADINVDRTSIRHLPTSSLVLTFPRQTGPPLRATYQMKKMTESAGKSTLIYVFEFSPNEAPSARSLVGGRVTADLILKLSTEAILVPKLDLVRSAPEVFKEKGWWVGVEVAFPGYRTISVGQTQVAIVKIPTAKDE